VNTERESLADYVRRIRNEKGLSLSDVRRASGNRIANSHISRIENGEVKGVGVEKLTALAKGLGIPGEELFAVARGRIPAKQSDADEQKLLFAFRDLDPGEKKSALRILEALRAGSDGLEREGTDGRSRKRRRSA
jgi:transcriptional regulator with XRE-family HTH domain